MIYCLLRNNFNILVAGIIMDDMYYEDVVITNEKGLYKLAKSKTVLPPELEKYNGYYLITNNQSAAANDIVFRLSKDEYDYIIKSNFNELFISNIMNKQFVLHYIIHKPEK